MTRRPEWIPPDDWARSFRGAVERLNRNMLRLYCAGVPRILRRRLLWLPDHFGLIGVFIAVGISTAEPAVEAAAVIIGRRGKAR